MTNQSIVILLQQYSIVVEGIANKLKGKGYTVSTVIDRLDQIEAMVERTDLFIIYAPDNLSADIIRKKYVEKILDALKDTPKKKMVIGDRKDHEELLQSIPLLTSYIWFDKPVDMELFLTTIDRVLNEAASPQIKASADGPRRLLIVDDDPQYAKMVREWIKDTYETHVVTAGMQAIKFLLNNPVDMILLDYEMPVVDGPQVLQMLRSEPATEKIPVVFLTGVDAKESVERVMALRPAGYLLKSTSKENIIKYIDALFVKLQK